MIELIAISYSPWSEKARWALDHHGVRYDEVEYMPMLGEPALRKRLGKWTGKISVPLLIKSDGPIQDSYKIAKYAEEIGSNPTSLFPPGMHEKIAGWNEQSEMALEAGRALVSIHVLEDPAAQREAMPPMPKPLLGALKKPVAAMGVAFLRRKYGYGKATDEHRRNLRQVLSNVRGVLGDGRPFLLGDEFSYADICAAVSIHCIKPVTDEFIKLGPATRKAWTDEELASEFETLLDWRDQLYESQRHT